jgi:hypothetical protein
MLRGIKGYLIKVCKPVCNKEHCISEGESNSMFIYHMENLPVMANVATVTATRM